METASIILPYPTKDLEFADLNVKLGYMSSSMSEMLRFFLMLDDFIRNDFQELWIKVDQHLGQVFAEAVDSVGYTYIEATCEMIADEEDDQPYLDTLNLLQNEEIDLAPHESLPYRVAKFLFNNYSALDLPVFGDKEKYRFLDQTLPKWYGDELFEPFEYDPTVIDDSYVIIQYTTPVEVAMFKEAFC